ncbi:hypothetical protein K474DRAFT_1260203 [Panus rudis PR-1116 ss-1]|nr:hypothetical protein K474DRAFT_1260203 [Panus rudis PR-1116 ss-1]
MAGLPSTQHDAQAGSDDDPAASLRAAALLTLKSKRSKKQNAGSDMPHGLPPRPVTVDAAAIQLDYGQEEPPSGASSIASSSAPPPPPPKPAPAPAPASAPAPTAFKEDEDPQGREEGEISDSDDTPPRPPTPVKPKAQPKPQPKPPQTTTGMPKRPPPVKSPERKKPVTPPPRSPSPRRSPQAKPPPARTATQPNLDLPQPAAMTSMPPPPVLPAHYDQQPVLVDPEHIRPGLTMTQAEYDTAKDHILDLLGWGVPPEYLVNCGLSREMVFYVFVEMNLRLPANLDISDLLEQMPSSAPHDHPAGEPSTFSPTSMGPPPLSARSTAGHPSLPQKPSDPQGTTQSPRLSATAAPFVPETPTATSGPNLHDIEQQRRQELLARKAAATSRLKSKSVSLIQAPTAVDPAVVKAIPGLLEKAASTGSVANDTVDDFLKSISPVSKESSLDDKSAEPVANSDAMDVDEAIPGLSIPQQAVVQETVTRTITTTTTVSPVSTSFSNASSSSIASTTQSFRGTSTEVTRKEDDNRMDVDGSGSSTPTNGSNNSNNGVTTSTARRAGRRPVAADFVDMDSPAAPSSRSNGWGSGPYYRDGAPRRRNGAASNYGTSFAGVSGTRRMVIELSDDEGEGEDGGNRHHHQQSSSATNSRYRPYPSRGGQASSSTVVSSSRPITPSILQEKETEIRRMRELIAKAEEERLKKKCYSSFFD